jgi:signal transduction histidine kinase
VNILLQSIRNNLVNKNNINQFDFKFDEFKELSYEIQKLITENQDARKNEVIAEIASQVSHDIRSPLAALQMVAKDLATLPEDTRLIIRGSLGRINDIANSLLQKNRELLLNQQSFSQIKNKSDHKNINTPLFNGAKDQSVYLLPSLIDDIVSEKRVQYRSNIGLDISVSLNPDSYGFFANIQLIEFKRVISNLINNAVEVFEEEGKIIVSLGLNRTTSESFITITDNGKGIPADILKNLGNKGNTFGKIGGSGLGLYHAKKTIESWGGRLNILSNVGKGTTIEIFLPVIKSPSWFVEKLDLRSKQKIIILDDDNSIHQVWDQRFEINKVTSKGIEVIHFSTPLQFKDWVKLNRDTIYKTLFLMDYELLGFKETGLDLIEELPTCQNAILVTSRYEELKIRNRCESRSIRLIPKSMAYHVPLSIQ